MCRLMLESYSKQGEVSMLQLPDVLQLYVSNFAYVKFPSSVVIGAVNSGLSKDVSPISIF